MDLHSSSQSVTPLHRCFFALRLTGAVIAYLLSIIEELSTHGARVRWTPASNLHLTLRFLGELDDDQLQRARQFAPEANYGHPLRVRADGLGAFPSLRAPRVLWAGLSTDPREEMERLLALQRATESHARWLGLRPETRPWSPHVTLARIPHPSSGLRRVMDAIATRQCLSACSEVRSVVLMRSKLLPSGASYEVVSSWPIVRESGQDRDM